MEAKVLIPLLSVLVGAFIGALSSITTIWLQQRAQSKREKIRLATEIARDDHKLMYEIAKEQGINGTFYPVVAYQHFHYEILEALEKGNLTDKELVKIKVKNEKLLEAIRDSGIMK